MALNDAPRCTARAKTTGEQCKNPAVAGSDKCRMHGGKTPRGVESASYKHGLYSGYMSSSIGDKAQRFLEADPFELVSELALLRALLAEYLSRFNDGVSNPKRDDIMTLAELTERVGRFSERINKMRNDTALTGAELTFVTARVADIVVKYIDDPGKQRAFVIDLVGTMGPAVTGGS